MGEFTIPRDYTTNAFTDADNLNPAEGQNPAKAVDAAWLGENQLDRQRYGERGNCPPLSIGIVAAQITLNLPAGVIDAEHRVKVTDGQGHTWYGVADADDRVIITDTPVAGKCHLIDGAPLVSGGNDYTTPGYVAEDFEVWGVGSTNHVPAIGGVEVGGGGAPGGLYAGDIEMADDDSDTVHTRIVDLEVAFEEEHSLTTGTHDNGFLENLHIDPDAFVTEGFANLLNNGGFEDWGDGIAVPPYGWTLTAGATTTIARTTDSQRGLYACYVNSLQNGDMLSRSIISPTDYADKQLSGFVWVKHPVDRILKIYLWGNVSGSLPMTTATGTGDWQCINFTHATDVADTDIQIRIVRDDATDFAFTVDTAIVYEGRLRKAWGASVEDGIRAYSDNVRNTNFLLNPNFDIFASTTSWPMGWKTYGPGIGITVGRTGGPYFGHNSCTITPANNLEGISQDIGSIAPLLAFLKGKTICFSIYIKRPGANATTYRIEIDDGVTSTANAFDIASYDDWTLISVVHTVDSAATKLDCNVYRFDMLRSAGAVLSNACLNVGNRPLPVIGPRPSAWQGRDFTFWKDETCATGIVLNQRQEVYENLYPLYMSVYANTAPVTKNYDFKLYKAGADTGFMVRLATGQNHGHVQQVSLAAAEADLIAPDDMIHVQSLQDGAVGSDPADVRVAMRAYTLAL